MGFGVWGVGFEVWGFGVGDWGLGVRGWGFGIWCSEEGSYLWLVDVSLNSRPRVKQKKEKKFGVWVSRFWSPPGHPGV